MAIACVERGADVGRERASGCVELGGADDQAAVGRSAAERLASLDHGGIATLPDVVEDRAHGVADRGVRDRGATAEALDRGGGGGVAGRRGPGGAA